MLIVSDVHMIHGEPSDDTSSIVSVDSRYADEFRNPLNALDNLMKKFGPINWILCPGDLGDRHDPACLSFVWTRLELLRRNAGASHLFGTVGNHDVDSRHISEREHIPHSRVQGLDPPFPKSPHADDSKQYSDSFFANGFQSFEDQSSNVGVVILNSSAFHGYSSGEIQDGQLIDEEYHRGKINPLAITELKRFLKSKTVDRCILMLHHHLVSVPDYDDNVSVLADSDDLVELLADDNANWFVVHGHLHLPKFFSDDEFDIPVLSSGAVGGRTWNSLGAQPFPENQVHVLEFSDDCNWRGKIWSWSWSNGKGWMPAAQDSVGLQHLIGFGAESQLTNVTDKVVAYLEETGSAFWNDLVEKIPDLKFLRPNLLKKLCSDLEERKVETRFDSTGLMPVGMKVIAK